MGDVGSLCFSRQEQGLAFSFFAFVFCLFGNYILEKMALW